MKTRNTPPGSDSLNELHENACAEIHRLKARNEELKAELTYHEFMAMASGDAIKCAHCGVVRYSKDAFAQVLPDADIELVCSKACGEKAVEAYNNAQETRFSDEHDYQLWRKS